jgi:hypothetical protein
MVFAMFGIPEAASSSSKVLPFQHQPSAMAFSASVSKFGKERMPENAGSWRA